MVSDPEWPIYYADDEGWMVECADDQQLATRIEPNDVQSEAYRCWDVRGRAIELEAVGQRAVIGGVSECESPEALKEAMLRYAVLAQSDSDSVALLANDHARNLREVWTVLVRTARVRLRH